MIHGHRALEVAARVENFADADPRRDIGRIELDGPAITRERLVGLSLLGLDVAQDREAETRFPATRRWPSRTARRLVEPVRLRRPRAAATFSCAARARRTSTRRAISAELRVELDCGLERAPARRPRATAPAALRPVPTSAGT